MAHPEAGEIDAVLSRAPLDLLSGPADDRHLVAALGETRRRLKHLVNRPGVELIELEDLEDAHWVSSVYPERSEGSPVPPRDVSLEALAEHSTRLPLFL
jgi:hypothetical protein